MGEFLSLKGLTEDGLKLDKKEFTPNLEFKNLGLKEISSFYPKKEEKPLFFDRKDLKIP